MRGAAAVAPRLSHVPVDEAAMRVGHGEEADDDSVVSRFAYDLSVRPDDFLLAGELELERDLLGGPRRLEHAAQPDALDADVARLAEEDFVADDSVREGL